MNHLLLLIEKLRHAEELHNNFRFHHSLESLIDDHLKRANIMKMLKNYQGNNSLHLNLQKEYEKRGFLTDEQLQPLLNGNY